MFLHLSLDGWLLGDRSIFPHYTSCKNVGDHVRPLSSHTEINNNNNNKLDLQLCLCREKGKHAGQREGARQRPKINAQKIQFHHTLSFPREHLFFKS